MKRIVLSLPLLLGVGAAFLAQPNPASAAADAPSAQLETDPAVALTTATTALVVTDPQNDFLSPEGVTWGVVGESVTENHTVENIEALFETAKAEGIPVFVSPHYYYPHDHRLGVRRRKLEALMHEHRHVRPTRDALEARWLRGLRELTGWSATSRSSRADNTVVTSPHKVYGPETNDLVLQLRKRGIRQGAPGGHVGQPVHRVAPARAARAGLRRHRGRRRHRGGEDAGARRRLRGRSDQLPILGQLGRHHRASRRGHARRVEVATPAPAGRRVSGSRASASAGRRCR